MQILIVLSALLAVTLAQFNAGQYNGQYNRFGQKPVYNQPTYKPPTFKQPVYKPTPAPYKPAPVILVDPVKPIIPRNNEIPILRQSSQLREDGSYEFSYETGNGIVANEAKTVSANQPNGQVIGSYRYVSPEGLPVEIAYYADENGFQAQGDAIPVAPAIPEYILKSLEYNRVHAGEYDDQGNLVKYVKQAPTTTLPPPPRTTKYVPRPLPTTTYKPLYKQPQYKPFQSQYKPRF